MSYEEIVSSIETRIGKIAVHLLPIVSDKPPVVFLHGVYLDHSLWDKQVQEIKDRTVILLDMPHSGDSREISKPYWTLDDCAEMLLDIMDQMNLPKIIAIGHSWGSMTILRAAHRNPERFVSIGLCNMPYQSFSSRGKFFFRLQHLLLPFRGFYMRKAAEALFGAESLVRNPSLYEQLSRTMSRLSDKEIRQIDKAVIIDAVDATAIIRAVHVKARALKGREDYVPIPPGIETTVVAGGHISPLESPEEVSGFIQSILHPDFGETVILW